ncbi:MAG TPA: glycoside hydrolase family 2 TIM barrel-domain containing protein [Chloroflexota bacterium]|jgi:hypothetical protein|nr:glycoside hydrolase family 2 TIM barrel-domain containing protein [Chloroflexota bacterium]
MNTVASPSLPAKIHALLAGRGKLSSALVLAAGSLAYIVLRPVFGLGHELAVAGLAWFAHLAVASMLWQPFIGWIGLDPIYSGAAIRALGGVQVQGLAVGSPLGESLHALLPVLFQPPRHLAEGAGISMVATPGAPALGRGLAAFGADVLWLALGMWWFLRWRRRNWMLASIGVLVQAQIAVNHLFDSHVGVADLEASGLPFALALAVPGSGWFTTAMAHQSGVLEDVLIGAILVGLGYVCALAALGAGLGIARIARRGVIQQPTVARGTVLAGPRHGVMALGLAIAIAASPVGALALGESNWQAAPLSMQTSRPGGAHWLGLTRAPRVGPTHVELAQAADGNWTYLVDGVPDVIRGVGYNPQYATLSEAERTQLYDRDFSAMQALGINTIEGWFEWQFDEVTLDAANRNDIGVVMPFELNQDWPYDNPNVRQSILDHVTTYVQRYKDNPAVRMWAPGNENLHRILYPRWVSQEGDPTARARADAFAAFLPQLVDRIHELDPNHPVLYRDAEDVYLSRIRSAFDAAGQTRPWLAYGANVYSTARLRDVVGAWPKQWPGRALLISEFAPGGTGPAERPVGFEQQWQIIRSRPGVVIGGLAYTWATNGPEELDRVFGFVDPAGVPTDGALAALAAAYLTDVATANTQSKRQ